MASKIFNLRHLHKSMALMPKFKCRSFQPLYMHRRFNSTNMEHGRKAESTGPDDQPGKPKLGFRQGESNVVRAIDELGKIIEKGLSDIETNAIRNNAQLSFIEWKLNLIGGIIIAFLGYTGYQGKRLWDIYRSQIAPDIPHHDTRTTGGSGGPSNEAGKA